MWYDVASCDVLINEFELGVKGPTNSLTFFIRCNPQQLLHLEECNPVSWTIFLKIVSGVIRPLLVGGFCFLLFVWNVSC